MGSALDSERYAGYILCTEATRYLRAQMNRNA
jgi:hypothetical protein